MITVVPAFSAEPLHVKIDALLAKAHPGGEAALANDADFLRRTYLALHGVIPTAEQARAFFSDTAPDKRAKLVDSLLADRQFARWMAVRFDVMLMERRAETQTKAAPWRDWLEESFAANKPWTALVRDILTADGTDPKTRHLARWLLERDADPNALTKDTGRLFLGRDISCSQCHDHPRIDDYFQRDYAGIQAFFSRTYLFKGDAKKAGPTSSVGEQASGETTYLSVFTKAGGSTRPRLPGERELSEPQSAEWKVPPNEKDKKIQPVPKFSRRAMLADALGDGHHPAFRRNIANRLWAIVFGSGLVEPLDLHHSANPPSNPELLAVLGDEIATMKFDMRAFIRELALTKAFQRSLDLPAMPADFAKNAEKKLAELEKNEASLATAVAPAEEEVGKLQKSIEEAQRAVAPFVAEQTKQETAVATARKPHDTALAEQKKADDAVAAKSKMMQELAAALAKLNEPAADADPEKVAQNAKALATKVKAAEAKIAANAKEIATLETAAAKKKAATAAAANALATAQEKATAAKAKADEAGKEISGKQTAFDAAVARKKSARIRARFAAQMMSELKAVIAAGGTVRPGASDDAKAALSGAWSRSFAAADLLPLAPEQLCWSAMQATGQITALRAAAEKEWDAKNKQSDADKADPAKRAARDVAIGKLLRDKLRAQEDVFVRFFGGAAGQPQTDFFATPEQALYFENGGVVRGWAATLANRAAALPDTKAMAEEIYLSTLTRMPEPAEVAEITATLDARPRAKKADVLGDFAWALLSSNEFRFVH
ncbi:MAG: DUF1549 domain-containing protein [Chthoniobacteraceae bacterium]